MKVTLTKSCLELQLNYSDTQANSFISALQGYSD